MIARDNSYIHAKMTDGITNFIILLFFPTRKKMNIRAALIHFIRVYIKRKAIPELTDDG